MRSAGLAWPAGPAGAAGRAGTIRWQDCPEQLVGGVPAEERHRYDCASYAVPVDHGRPAAGSVSLALLRRAADDPAHRIGSLFVNPGGPGGRGTLLPIELDGVLPAEVLRRFDVVGFDPRGVGLSAAIRCFATDEEAEAVYGGVVPVPVTRPQIESTLRANRELTDACAARGGPLLAHVSTANVARDLDRLRAAVGDRRLTYLGFSYGTLVGATYANLYPHRVRAIVGDGNVDPALRTTNGLEYLRRRAVGMESVIDAFLRRCAEVGARCAFSGGDPEAKLADIRRRLRQGPVTVPGLGEVDLSAFTTAVAFTLYAPQRYAELAAQLQAVYEAIHPTGGGPLAASPRLAAAGTPYTGNESEYAVTCADEPYPANQNVFPAVAPRWERQAPTVGRAHAFGGVFCATWPARHPDRYDGPWNRVPAQPLLLFGNYHDPATNYAFNQRMAAQLGGARLVSVDAFGHTSLGRPNRPRSGCAQAIAARYLVDLVLPPPGVVCPTDTPPFSA
ncbi:alpha/beta fold hydrolase [Phytohabitans rumicis]|uniref:Peptidase n=1 Tax=Phytohabitans rumicis TaxID=1076125 RepID=A0A6V8KVX8_9ACTN|nr:alpha/beta hydrolase [Phytohabitans rumicis]GFJ86551.1 peptidase [Phytohabitans rumicis]